MSSVLLLLAGVVLGDIWATYGIRAMIEACMFCVLFSISYIRRFCKNKEEEE